MFDRFDKIEYFDLHCDTFTEIAAYGLELTNNSLHISLEKAMGFNKYTQIFAVCSNPDISENEAYTRTLEILNYSLPRAEECKRLYPQFSYIPAIEGGRILSGDVSRLDTLYNMGVRILTLVWSDLCCIGGAFNTDEGLTDFGFKALNRCFELGIVPDVSHASDKMFYQTAEAANAAGRPFIASHSNSRAVCNHRRNLTDDMFKCILKAKGIVGISLAPQHLKNGYSEENPQAAVTYTDIIRHAEHYLSLGGKDTLCLGCDFDGIATTPDKIDGISSIPCLYEEFLKHFSEDTVKNIFYKNAEKFMLRNYIL